MSWVLILYAEGTKLHAPYKNFQSLTVERLRALLKEKGLSLRGKKASIIIQKCVLIVPGCDS